MNPNRDMELDVAKFEFLWPLAYPYYSKLPLITRFVKKLVKDDVIGLGQMFEKAISVQCKLERDSTNGRDFVIGSDAKLVAARTYNYGQSYGAPVTNIHAKTGNLLVGVYERKQKNWYFFNIPHSEYQHIPTSSNIEIPFDFDGTPRRRNRCTVNWWDFEVDKITDFKIDIHEYREQNNNWNYFDELFKFES